MKRIIVTIALLALVIPVFGSPTSESTTAGFNETGLPIVDKPVSIRVLGARSALHRKPFNELPVVMKTEKQTNVHIDWIEVPMAGFEEKKNLMLASGDLPDAISHNLPDFDIVTYGAAGVFIPLQDLIDKYAANYKKVIAQKPDIIKFTTAPDGNIYSFARLNEGSWMRQLSVHGIYKPWVDKLGMSMPKTTEEFYNLMVAFKRNDPNGNGKADEVPIAMAVGDGNAIGRSQPFFVYYAFGLPTLDTNAAATAHLFVENGKVKFAPVEERFKQATIFLHRLWQAGLIEPEAYTLNYAQLNAKIQAEPVSYGVISHWNLNDLFNPSDPRQQEYVPLQFFAAPGVPEPAVYRQPYPGWNRSQFTITKADKYPEVTVRWADYIYEPYESMEWIEGMIGSRLVKDAKGVVTMKDPPAGVTTQEYRMSETQPDVPLAATMEMYRTIFPAPLYELKGATIDEYYVPHWDKEFWSNPLIGVEDSKQLNAIDPDLRSYFTRMQAKWITQGGIEQEWDGYLKQMETLGVSKMLQIRQAAYDRQK
jgi:putative aldouronate transport system substrate-binding protein